MNWNRDEVCRLLDARVTDEVVGEGGHVTIVYFEDARMRYELWINEDGVFLGADPERPIQGLPFFEISLPCTVLAPVARSGMPTGIGMYSGRISPDTLCFAITRREDGIVSLSGAWAGMWTGLQAAHTCHGTVASQESNSP